jgi:hypothetical protein
VHADRERGERRATLRGTVRRDRGAGCIFAVTLSRADDDDERDPRRRLLLRRPEVLLHLRLRVGPLLRELLLRLR